MGVRGRAGAGERCRGSVRSKATAQSSARVCGDPLGALGRLMRGIKLKYRLAPSPRTAIGSCGRRRHVALYLYSRGPAGRPFKRIRTNDQQRTRIHVNDASDSNSCACKVKDLRSGNGHPGADPRRNDRSWKATRSSRARLPSRGDSCVGILLDDYILHLACMSCVEG